MYDVVGVAKRQHADYIVNAWISHSQRVAERHDLRVTDDDLNRASAPDDPIECNKGCWYVVPTTSNAEINGGCGDDRENGRNRT
jgi:hypothetical protein